MKCSCNLFSSLLDVVIFIYLLSAATGKPKAGPNKPKTTTAKARAPVKGLAQSKLVLKKAKTGDLFCTFINQLMLEKFV